MYVVLLKNRKDQMIVIVFPLSQTDYLNLIDFDMDATTSTPPAVVLLVLWLNASWEKSVTNGDLIILQKMLRDENC